MRPSVFFRYRSRKWARDRPISTQLRPTLLFAIRLFVLTVTALVALSFTAIATRAPLPPGADSTPEGLNPTKSADILADIRSRWPVRLIPPEWIVKPGEGDALVPTELVWLRVEGRARLFVIVAVYLLSIGLIYRRHRQAAHEAASGGGADPDSHTAGKITP